METQNSTQAYTVGPKLYSRAGRLMGTRKIRNTAESGNVQSVSEKHHEAIRMLVLGYTVADIGRHLGLTPVQVSNIKSSPLVRAQLQTLLSKRDEQTVQVAVEMEKDAINSLRFLQAIRDGKAEDAEGNPIPAAIGLRASVALGLMDRAGYSPVKRIQGEVIHGHLTMDEIAAVKRKAQAARGLAAGQHNIVEAEVIEECER